MTNFVWNGSEVFAVSDALYVHGTGGIKAHALTDRRGQVKMLATAQELADYANIGQFEAVPASIAERAKNRAQQHDSSLFLGLWFDFMSAEMRCK